MGAEVAVRETMSNGSRAAESAEEGGPGQGPVDNPEHATISILEISDYICVYLYGYI